MRLAVMVIIAVAAALAPAGPAPAASGPGPEHPVVISFFWGDGCPHCEKERAFLRDLRKKQPALVIREYEVWKDRENAGVYRRVLQAARAKQGGVPLTVVGTSVFLGFNDQNRRAIEEAVSRCRQQGCPDGVALAGKAALTASGMSEGAVAVPFFGTIDPSAMSLPLFTVIIAGLDSFNPCAFFVLLFLLSLLIHARSRRRMLIIGGVFVFFSGLIYFLFMAAWLNLFMLAGQLAVITAAGGIIALLIGGINVKDFFFFRQGVSLVIPESAKPRLFERMRGLLKAPTLPAMLSGTLVLAVSANAYELLCTAGFPLVYTRVLTLHGLPTFQYYRYLALYNAVYVVPLAVIVAAVTVTLGARKLTEWQGRQLKLVSGLMMLSLGAVLIIDPGLLNSILASVLLLAGVIAASLAAIIVMKRVRPDIAHG
jgi:thiol-disulfide isomerase/thioredoxin